MNKFQADEQAAAAQLRAKAATLVSTYAEPHDAAAARLGALIFAVENEAKDQGKKSFIKLLHRLRHHIDKNTEQVAKEFESYKPRKEQE